MEQNDFSNVNFTRTCFKPVLNITKMLRKKSQKLVNVKEFSDKINVTKLLNLTVNPIPLNKKEVVDYANQHGRNKAACHFELDATMVECWVKASSGWITEINQNSRQVSSDRKAFYPEAKKSCMSE